MSEQVIGFGREGLDSELRDERDLTDSVDIPSRRVEPADSATELEGLLVWRSGFCRSPRPMLDELEYQRRRYETAAERLARVRTDVSDARAVVAAVSSVSDFATASVAHPPVESETGIVPQHSAQYREPGTEPAATSGGVRDRRTDRSYLHG